MNLFFERAFLTPAVDDSAWMIFPGKEIDKPSAGVMSIYVIDIMDTLISSNSSILKYDDNVYDEYKLPFVNFSGVLVGPTVTFDEMSDPNDSDKSVIPVVLIFTARMLSILHLTQNNMLNTLMTIIIPPLTLIVKERHGFLPV